MKKSIKYCVLSALICFSVAAFAKPAYFTVENATANQLYVFGHGGVPPKPGGNVESSQMLSSQKAENLYVGTVLNPVAANAVAVDKLGHLELMADKENEIEKIGVFTIEDNLHRPICSYRYKNQDYGYHKKIVLRTNSLNTSYGNCMQKRLSYHRFEIIVTPTIS